METKKEITYLGKDFGQFRKNLIDFSKQYFPNTYTDFNEASPGMMFIEMAAYVGDVLSYYADNNLRESLLDQASERANIYDIASSLGYKPKNYVPAYVILNVYQLLPAAGSELMLPLISIMHYQLNQECKLLKIMVLQSFVL